MAKKPAGNRQPKNKKKAPKPKGTRKSTMTQKRKNANKSEAMLAGFKKLSVITLIFLLFVWGMGWYILSDGPARTSLWLRQSAINLSSGAGFIVREILVEGRRNTDADILLAIVNIRKGDPLFSFVPHEAKKMIERIGWVKSAHVERQMPDTIYIALTEREPAALWLHNDVLSLVDAQGHEITREKLERFKDLMMIRGQGAPERTGELLSLLNKKPDIKEKIDHAALIDERRWDLVMKGDMRIKLPEKNTADAIAHIMERHAQNNILNNEKIVEIDARYKDRLIVRTRLGQLQDYKAGIE
ncbi:MAG: cell division protein FtsQ/DivIB [Alphaproteobacteria bacterium]